MLFWIAAGGITLAVGAILLLAGLRAGGSAAPAAEFDLQVYRDQLREVDRDEARGVIGAEDAARLKTELGRKVLEADRARAAATGDVAPPRSAQMALSVAVLALMLGGVWAYVRLGAPGYPDLPIAERLAMAEEAHANRATQAEAVKAAAANRPAPPQASAEFLGLMDKLRAALKDRPDDAEGHRLLARNEASLGNFDAAIAAQDKVISISGDKATGEDHAVLAEMMILNAGGFVSPEAEAELSKALQLDPGNGTAIYYAGLMFLQNGRPDRTFQLWAPLLDRSGKDDPWVEPIRANIEMVAEAAGEQYTLPLEPGAPGPSAADVQAAGEMSAEDRQQMIRGMVEQLNDRLASQGGSPEEWARLVTAYAVLGETDKAKATWDEAQTAFAGQDNALATIRDAALGAGVAP
ncbi:c-type cytochrome biogenesis protein CcmI [Tabrizicola sp. J26]|uniref:c-type cytochrome biogenesis protein CcmI n=1 Tax=Alitabrizicola rongguiensis TaxID=2909234 RepID=UPI001F434F8B|nr:c-type cytochrome biogenesis protein CcmI [Tabrizicola rongguiensis]MCF1709620.1 c-type cytochrome biogenesis protein CcmI [Tabrizicola rongguiensis]